MKKASPRIRSMQYFICDMYSEKCFLQIVNLSTGFLTRFLIGGKSFGVGRELEKTYPATCMHWIESVSSYREGLCRGMPPGKILKSGPLRVHFQHSGAKIRVCEQKIDIIKFWFLGVPLRGTKITMVFYKSMNSLLEELKHIKKSYLFWDKEYLDGKISKKLIGMFLAYSTWELSR